jgi:hypothetical protein
MNNQAQRAQQQNRAQAGDYLPNLESVIQKHRMPSIHSRLPRGL